MSRAAIRARRSWLRDRAIVGGAARSSAIAGRRRRSAGARRPAAECPCSNRRRSASLPVETHEGIAPVAVSGRLAGRAPRFRFAPRDDSPRRAAGGRVVAADDAFLVGRRVLGRHEDRRRRARRGVDVALLDLDDHLAGRDGRRRSHGGCGAASWRTSRRRGGAPRRRRAGVRRRCSASSLARSGVHDLPSLFALMGTLAPR